MNILELVNALLSYDTLTARQWLADAERSGFSWSKVPAPGDLDPTASALAAGHRAPGVQSRAGSASLGGQGASRPSEDLPGPCGRGHAQAAGSLRAGGAGATEAPRAPRSSGVPYPGA